MRRSSSPEWHYPAQLSVLSSHWHIALLVRPCERRWGPNHWEITSSCSSRCESLSFDWYVKWISLRSSSDWWSCHPSSRYSSFDRVACVLVARPANASRSVRWETRRPVSRRTIPFPWCSCSSGCRCIDCRRASLSSPRWRSWRECIVRRHWSLVSIHWDRESVSSYPFDSTVLITHLFQGALKMFAVLFEGDRLRHGHRHTRYRMNGQTLLMLFEKGIGRWRRPRGHRQERLIIERFAVDQWSRQANEMSGHFLENLRRDIIFISWQEIRLFITLSIA